MFRGLGLHRTDDGQLIGNGGTLRHQFTEMNPRQFGRDTSKRPARDPSWFGVPGLELAGGSAQPEQDAAFLLLFGNLGKNLGCHQA